MICLLPDAINDEDKGDKNGSRSVQEPNVGILIVNEVTHSHNKRHRRFCCRVESYEKKWKLNCSVIKRSKGQDEALYTHLSKYDLKIKLLGLTEFEPVSSDQCYSFCRNYFNCI